MKSKIQYHDLFCPKCFHYWQDRIDINYLNKITCKKCGCDIEYSIDII